MEIHKPKPVHSWREFVKEYAIIVVGVLTALAAEQAVETLHEHSRANEARANIRAEFLDDLKLMKVRGATEKCISKRLEEVDGLLQKAAVGLPIQDEVWIGHPALWSMPDSRYHSATQAGDVTRLPSEEQAAYATIYAAFAEYYQAEQAEQKAWSDLRVLEGQPSVSGILDWQLRSAVKQARTARWTMEAYSLSAMLRAETIGVRPTQVNYFKLQSVCIPMQTPRAEALKLVAQNRPFKAIYDEP